MPQIFAAFGFCVFLPTLLLTLCDAAEAVESVGDGGPSMKVVEAAADDVNKLATKQANQAAVAQIHTRLDERAAALFMSAGAKRRARDQSCGEDQVNSGVESKVAEAARAIQNFRKRRDGSRSSSGQIRRSITGVMMEEASPLVEDTELSGQESRTPWQVDLTKVEEVGPPDAVAPASIEYAVELEIGEELFAGTASPAGIATESMRRHGAANNYS